MKMVVGDLAAIEYVVVGYLARSVGILQTIKEKKDAYINFAPKLFPDRNYTYEGLLAEYELYQKTGGKQGSEEFRQLSKPPILGGGFGLGGGDLYINEFGDEVRGGLWGYALNVCGVDMPRELAHAAVKAYREAYPEVPQLWTDMEQAFKQVLKRGGKITVGKVTWDKWEKKWLPVQDNFTGAYITFSRVRSEKNGYIIRMQLPSGRFLHYLNARTRMETVMGKDGKPWEREGIVYDGVEHSAVMQEDGSTKKGAAKWGETKTYGGKLTENAVQAIARDILVNGAHLAKQMGFRIWGLFHDEIATLIHNTIDSPGLDDLLWCMSQPPKWAPTMMLSAAGWTGNYYHKG